MAKRRKPYRFLNSAGPLIRKARLRRRLTQVQLAARLQILGLVMDQATYSKIELQTRSLFDFELALIAKTLGVPAGDLLPGTENLKKILPSLYQGKIKK